MLYSQKYVDTAVLAVSATAAVRLDCDLLCFYVTVLVPAPNQKLETQWREKQFAITCYKRRKNSLHVPIGRI